MSRWYYVTCKELLIFVLIINCTWSHPTDAADSPSSIRHKKDVNAIQSKLIEILKPKPVVDTLTEVEKCCNQVQHAVGRKLIGIYDKITGALSNVVQLPEQKANKFGAGVTDFLNQIGGRLVGLQ